MAFSSPFRHERIGEYSEGGQQTATAKPITIDSIDPLRAILYVHRHACDF